jgi:hypothetical protein
MTNLPVDPTELVDRAGPYGQSDEKPREIPWAGLVDDTAMVPAERLDEELAARWADDLDRDRG